MTDLLGVMEAWSATHTAVRAEDGSVVDIDLADIVSGKPVPPRASPRLRVSADEATRRANASWPAEHVEPLGEWLLRAAGGFSARANSVMASGDPGTTTADALRRTEAFYARHGLPAWAQVTVGSAEHAAFEDAGWVHARPGEADSLFQIASVAQARRAAGRRLPAEPPLLEQRATVGASWLASDPRAAAHERAARAVLEGPEEVVFVSAPPSGSRDEPATPRDAVPLVCRGRAAVSGDWVGITDVWVAPDHRGRRLAGLVLHTLLGWAAERGATTAYLQVRGDNPPAVALYERLGFVTHHAYRYLAPRP